MRVSSDPLAQKQVTKATTCRRESWCSRRAHFFAVGDCAATELSSERAGLSMLMSTVFVAEG